MINEWYKFNCEEMGSNIYVEMDSKMTHTRVVPKPGERDKYWMHAVYIKHNAYLFEMFEEAPEGPKFLGIALWHISDVKEVLSLIEKPSWLPEVSKPKISCTCSSWDLANFGCRCGAFKKERNG